MSKIKKTEQADQATNDNQDYIQIINEQQTKIAELTDLAQRTQANFENYRKHVEQDLARSKQVGESTVVKKLLPIIDTLDSAMGLVPSELQGNDWVKGVIGVHKNLDKMMAELNLRKQNVKVGDEFDYNQHEAIMNEGGDGDKEVIVEVLRAGYIYNEQIIRPALVKVAKQ